MRIAYSMADQNAKTSQSLGIYNISLELARTLVERKEVDRLHFFANSTLPLDGFQTSDKAIVSLHDWAIQSKPGRIIWDQWGVYRHARRADVDWVFLPKGYPSFSRRCPVKLALFIHDIIILHCARKYSRLTSCFEKAYFARSLAAAMKQASVIFTNTDFSRGEIAGWAAEQRLPCPPIITAGYGFSMTPVLEPKEDQTLVFLSNNPYKRSADVTIPYLERWRSETHYSGKLLCVGAFHANEKFPLPEAAHWQFLGRVAPEKTRELMRACRTVVFTSEYEGFGMPPVEAVLGGSCPVYSNIPPMREAMREAGFAFDNDRYESFREAMEKAMKTSESVIQSWAGELSRRHSWPVVSDRIVKGLAAA